MGFDARLGSTMALALGLAGWLFASHEGAAQAQPLPHPHGWLGVELVTRAGDSRGARVGHVVRGSPAASAGLRDDDVILRLDEGAVARPDDVIQQVAVRPPGRVVRLRVLRGALQMNVEVTLAPLPDGDEMLRLDKVGAPAPGWKRSLASVAGAVPASLGEMRGKVVVLDFWATWCMACRMAAPRLSSWQAKYGAQGLAVIGITDDPIPEASQGASSFGMNYSIASDESYATQRAFGVRALPTIFIIDKRGVIRDVSVGFDPGREKATEALLQTLLAEPAASSGSN
jgi:thiol-disulfide isomerase/thioredoxin